MIIAAPGACTPSAPVPHFRSLQKRDDFPSPGLSDAREAEGAEIFMQPDGHETLLMTKSKSTIITSSIQYASSLQSCVW